MNLFQNICRWLRAHGQRRAVKQEFDEELRFHIEQRTAENIAAGMSPEEAAREARKRFGNLQSVREECRERRGASFGEATWQDVRFGLRMLRKNPGFTAVAVLTLASGLVVASLTGCKHMASDRGAPQTVSFPTQDGGKVYAQLYGSGQHGVLLAHGGRFNKESWTNQARALVNAGFRVLAIDFRGIGQSQVPSNRDADKGRHFDVLAAVKYLRSAGATTVSVIGASMGGDYAAEAAETEPQAIDRLVLLAAGAYTPLVRMNGPKLFLTSRDDVIGDNSPRMPAIRDQYEKASGPKEFIALEGSAHAQHLFQTDQGERVMLEILRFLSAP